MADGGGAAPTQQEEPHIGPARAGLRIGCFNACGMLQHVYKLEESTARIKTLIDSGNDDKYFDVFVVVDTRLKSLYSEAEHKHIKEKKGLKIDGYFYLNYPRQFGTPGYGGILIYIREEFVKFTDTRADEQILSDNNEIGLQLVVVKITKPFQLNLVAVCNPDVDTTSILYESLGSCLKSLRTDIENVVVLGDFNSDLNHNTKEFCEENILRLRDDYQVDQHIQSPKFISSSRNRCLIYILRNSTFFYNEHEVIYKVIRKLCVADVEYIENDQYRISCVLTEEFICPEPCETSCADISSLKKHQVICQRRRLL